MSDHPEHNDLRQRVYPEDESLQNLQRDPDRRMTREQWEKEESAARHAANKKHEKVQHDQEVQEQFDKKKREQNRDWKKPLLWVGGGVFILLLIFLLGYLPRHEREKKAAAAAKQRELEQPEVEVVKVKRSHGPGELTVPGTTASVTEAYIYARANGYLRRRYVDIGDHVKKGQVLGLIDAPDLDQQVDQAREQLRQADAQLVQQQAVLNLNRVTWDRYRTLVAKGVFSRQDGDQQQTNYNSQVAQVANAQRQVDSYRANLARMIALQSYEQITAPFKGVITQRNADVGALLGSNGAASNAPTASPMASTGGSADIGSSNSSGSSGTISQSASPSTGQAQGGAIFGIAQNDKLRILVSVPEGYATEIKRGMPAKVFVQEQANKPITGTVTRTANSIDTNTRTMLVEVDIDNHDGGLYPGMYSVVSFVEVRGQSPLTVPGDAVAIRQDRTQLALVRDQKVQFVPVEIGRDYGPSVEIISGLKEGDLVVTSITDSVQPGARVRPRESQQASSEGGAQTNQEPDSGPDQYGDQSIVNSKSESTNQTGKKGQSTGGQGGGTQQQGGKSNKQGSNGKKASGQ